jgi:hypothetical protein
MLTKPRTVLVLTGIFFAGAVSGVFLAPLVHWRGTRRPPQEAFHERIMQRLEHVLDLNAEQRVAVDKLMRETAQELATQRRDSWQANTRKLQEMNAKIEALLTPEQRKKFGVFRQEQLERLNRRMGERGPRRMQAPGDMHPEGLLPPPDRMPREDGRPGEMPPPPEMQPGEMEPPPADAPQK